VERLLAITMEQTDIQLAEYKEALAEVRLHSTLMFGELTVYLGASAGLLQVASRVDATPSMRLGLSVAGIVLSVAFYVLHERFGDFVHVARRRARDLEQSLGFKLYSSAPERRPLFGVRIVTAINAARLLFVCGCGAWLVILIAAVRGG
jgi:hypothetical protein